MPQKIENRLTNTNFTAKNNLDLGFHHLEHVRKQGKSRISEKKELIFRFNAVNQHQLITFA